MKPPRTLTLSLLAWTVAGPIAVAAVAPLFSGLGDLPGGNVSSNVTAVSADGTTVCGFSSSTLSSARPQDSEAFRWRQNEGMVGLGYLQATEVSPFSPPVSAANWLSADGELTGGSGFFKTSGLDPFPDQVGAYWNGTAESTILPLLPSASSFQGSVSNGASANGLIMVGRSSSSTGERATIWVVDSGGTAQISSLGVLSTPPTASGDKLNRTSVAFAAASDGLTIVGSGSYNVTRTDTITPPPVPIYNPNPPYNFIRFEFPPPYQVDTIIESGSEAFKWLSGVGLQRLGDLNGGGWGSEALGVSADGSVIVGYGSSGPNVSYGLIWSNGGMMSVGDLPGGAAVSRLYDASGDGTIAVGLGNDATGRAAVIWDAENGLRKLSTLISGLGVDLTGWTLSTAEGISDDGDVIVGNGINPAGQKEGWRLSGARAIFAPTEPEIPSVAIELGKVLTFPTQPGDLYQAQYSYNLTDWLPLGESHSTVGAATASTHCVVDSDVSQGSKFYRLTLLPGSVSSSPPSFTMSQGAVLSFQTEPGYLYQVKQSSSLSAWTNLGSPISTAGDTMGITHTVFDPFTVYPNPSPSRNNYRVEIEAP